MPATPAKNYPWEIAGDQQQPHTLHTSPKSLKLRGRILGLCSFTWPTPNPPQAQQLLIKTNEPHTLLLFTTVSSTAIISAQEATAQINCYQTQGWDSSQRAGQESYLPFITTLKCLRVLKAALTPSYVPLTDVKATSRNTVIQNQEMKAQEVMVQVSILPNPD